jgi:hypothetical protein
MLLSGKKKRAAETPFFQSMDARCLVLADPVRVYYRIGTYFICVCFKSPPFIYIVYEELADQIINRMWINVMSRKTLLFCF